MQPHFIKSYIGGISEMIFLEVDFVKNWFSLKFFCLHGTRVYAIGEFQNQNVSESLEPCFLTSYITSVAFRKRSFLEVVFVKKTDSS
jgi:hypothetical protein